MRLLLMCLLLLSLLAVVAHRFWQAHKASPAETVTLNVREMHLARASEMTVLVLVLVILGVFSELLP